MSRLVMFGVIQDNPKSFFEPDSSSYIEPAKALYLDGRYHTASGSGVPETLRPPGYPAWLALVFLLFGENTNAIIFSHVLIFLGTLTVTFLLAAKMFGHRSAWVAVILLALDPSGFSHTFKVLSETLTTFFIVCFAYSTVLFIDSRGRKIYGLVSGLSLALATLVRPTTYYFFPLLLILIAIFLIREKIGGQKTLAGILTLAFPFVVIIGGWQYRNLEEAGVFQLTTVKGWALYRGKGAQIYGEIHHMGLREAENHLMEQLGERYPGWRQLPMAQLDEIYMIEGKKLVAGHPWLAVKTHIRQMAYFFFAPGTTSAFFRIFDPEFKIRSFRGIETGEYFRMLLKDYKVFLSMVIFGMVYIVCLYMFLFAWMISGWRESRILFGKGIHVILFLLILYVSAASSVNYGQDRYRIVVMPLLCMYSGAGAFIVLQNLKDFIRRLKGRAAKTL